jgi:hypothetical protein
MKRRNSKSSRVLEHLEKFGSITSWEAIENYGATRLSAIIYNLRDEGYEIISERVPLQIDLEIVILSIGIF